MKLRPYQQRSCDAAIDEVRTSIEPCLIEASPAAGKSFMIADLARRLHEMSGGKRVLVIAPSATLVKQDYEKFLLTGMKASIFSASAGAKSTRNFVVFATPLTVRNAISRFKRQGQDGYCAVIVDEAHGITPTIRDIIDQMREANPNLRVIGLTGTPYILNKGYIYRIGPEGTTNGDDVTRDPYFLRCVYCVSAQEMLADGFITPMQVAPINVNPNPVLLPNGCPQPAGGPDRAHIGWGDKTAQVVADTLEQAQDIFGGVMFFASSISHAEEILASLPIEKSGMVTGEKSFLRGKPAEQSKVQDAYRNLDIRYIVSVGQLTTGFDVSHTSVISLLRDTDSAALLEQILGRAWRLDDRKPHSIFLDYVGAAEKHFPDGNIYTPLIKAKTAPGAGVGREFHCPDCAFVNTFTVKEEFQDWPSVDAAGYCLDSFGEQVMTEYGPEPIHYGRRCFGIIGGMERGSYVRCNYRYTSKECGSCGEPNDISARTCSTCKSRLVDPNEKILMDFRAHKKDPYQVQTDEVLSMDTKENISARGNRTLRVDLKTPHRQFSLYFLPDAKGGKPLEDWRKFQQAREFGSPDTISYVKDRDSGFFRALAYNMEADAPPEKVAV